MSYGIKDDRSMPRKKHTLEEIVAKLRHAISDLTLDKLIQKEATWGTEGSRWRNLLHRSLLKNHKTHKTNRLMEPATVLGKPVSHCKTAENTLNSLRNQMPCSVA
jgi:hypothetical protein